MVLDGPASESDCEHRGLNSIPVTVAPDLGRFFLLFLGVDSREGHASWEHEEGTRLSLNLSNYSLSLGRRGQGRCLAASLKNKNAK